MTMKESRDHNSYNMPYILFLGLVAVLGGSMFGFDLGIIAGAGPFLKQHFHLSDLGLGWAFSSLLFGCIVGSILAGRLTDTYGRRKILLMVAVLFILTSVATGVAPTFGLLVAARFAGGIAVGGVSVLSPMYVAEVAPPRIRGRMGAAYQMSITTGILASFCINYELRNQGAANWRWMFISGVLPSLVFLIALIWAPESPRFLFKAGRDEEGFALLSRIMGPTEAATEARDIRASAKIVRSPGSGLDYRSLKGILPLTFFLAVLVHVSGIDAVIDYGPLVLSSSGWKIDAALFSTFVIGGINFLFTFISFWTIDRYGRRPLYIIGSLGMCLALVSIVLALVAGNMSGGLLLIAIAVFVAFFASCIGPVFWTLLPELFPNNVRGRAMVIPVVTQWLANAIVVLLFPLALHRVGRISTFAFLACMAGVQAFVAWKYLPETKGRSLEAIYSGLIREDNSVATQT